MTHRYVPPSPRLSGTLNVFAPVRWLFDLHPIWVAVVCVIISPGVMWFNDIMFVHGRFIPLDQQWLSALFDVALGLAVAVLVAMLRSIGEEQFPRFIRKRVLHWLLVAAAFALGVWHVWQERESIPSLERRLGPNSLYHNLFLYPFLGYVIGILVIAAAVVLFRGSLKRSAAFLFLAGCMLVVALLAGWDWAGKYDGAHQYAPGGTHKSYIANPPDPWCGGLLTKPICGPPQR